MRNHFSTLRSKMHHLRDHLKKGGWSVWKKIKYTILAIIALFVTAALATFFFILLTLPDIDNIENLIASESTLILDRNGEVLFTIHGDENRKIISFDQISPYAPLAAMAIEDDQFYEHSGVDIPAFLKALCGEFFICHNARGGSTITQQFVKNAFLSSERSYTRKAKEVILALQLENKYSKDEIMAMYLNRIPYGSSMYGIEVASQTLFDKPAADLTIAESAILASIPKAPTYYSPYGDNRNPTIELSAEEILENDYRSEQEVVEYINKGLIGKTYTYGEGEEARDIYVKGRVDFVLERMKTLGYITEEEYDQALEEAKNIQFQPFFDENVTAFHFSMYIRGLLEAEYGKDAVERGGFKVTTTLDAKMQAIAEEAIKEYGETNAEKYGAGNAALVSIDTNTGEVLALVGSRDFRNEEIEGHNNMALAGRSPGSSFKPIAYAAAFLKGYAPSTVIYDVRTQFSASYSPKNFDGKFMGPMTIRSALVNSRNITAVKAAHLAGVPNVIAQAQAMGINVDPEHDYGMQIALGGGVSASPLDMSLVYGTFANGGYKLEPVSILKIEDKEGNILQEYKAPTKKELVLEPQAAYLINNILSDASARPGGYWRDRLSLPGHVNGAKTGTSTNDEGDPLDAWLVGYTRDLSTAVWAGNADNKELNWNASGLDVAAPIWKKYMVAVTKDMPRKEFEKPEGIRWVKVSKRSGKLPSKHTPPDEVVSGIFASFSVPTEFDTSYQLIKLDKISGKLATEFTPEEAIEEKAFYTHTSLLPDNKAWQSAVRAWAKQNNQDEQPPTEYDDVHTAETMSVKPQILIISPKTKSKVAPPVLDVLVNVSSPTGVQRVEYFLNEELVQTVESSPFHGTLSLSKDLKKGSTHKLRAVVYDELYRSNQSTITFQIGADETKPNISFVYPTDEAKLTVGTSVSVQVDASDRNGAIDKVKFYLDDELQKEDSSSPFNWQFATPLEEGEHELKAIAYDHAGNKNTDKIIIEIVENEDSLQGSSRLLSPQKNTSFDEGDNILMEGFITAEDRDQLAEIVFLAKKEGKQPQAVASVANENELENLTYSAIWNSVPAGTYELYIKMVLKDGKLRFSPRVPIVVR